jgi:hypothetical protein
MNDLPSTHTEQQPVEQRMLEKLHSETALMHWLDLQKFFAQGKILVVDRSLDLVEIGVLFADDLASQLEPHIQSELIVQPSNDLARSWYQGNIELWTVVVAPYILVQLQKT